MEERLTEYQVREALAWGVAQPTEPSHDALIVKMRELPARPGAAGYSDEELKGTARDEAAG